MNYSVAGDGSLAAGLPLLAAPGLGRAGFTGRELKNVLLRLRGVLSFVEGLAAPDLGRAGFMGCGWRERYASLLILLQAVE